METIQGFQKIGFALPVLGIDGIVSRRRPVNDSAMLRKDLSRISEDAVNATVNFLQIVIRDLESSNKEKLK